MIFTSQNVTTNKVLSSQQGYLKILKWFSSFLEIKKPVGYCLKRKCFFFKDKKTLGRVLIYLLKRIEQDYVCTECWFNLQKIKLQKKYN